MANRLTDSRKWDDDWFLELESKHKLLWLYILDKCDHAGIYKKSRKLELCCLDEPVEWSRVENVFDKRLIKIKDNKYFLPTFIKFQYGELNPENRCHKSAIAILKSEGVYKGLIRGLEGRIRQDKDKDKGKDKETYKYIVDDLNAVTGSKYKTTEKTKTLIDARISEGFELEDFKVVHRKKFSEWSGDEKMCKYLRPETLYSNKFDGYVNQKEKKKEGIRAI